MKPNKTVLRLLHTQQRMFGDVLKGKEVVSFPRMR